MVIYRTSLDKKLLLSTFLTLQSSSAQSPLSKTAAAPIPVPAFKRFKVNHAYTLHQNFTQKGKKVKEGIPMHIDITPKRQSLPRLFISCNRVATQRAPVKSTK